MADVHNAIVMHLVAVLVQIQHAPRTFVNIDMNFGRLVTTNLLVTPLAAVATVVIHLRPVAVATPRHLPGGTRSVPVDQNRVRMMKIEVAVDALKIAVRIANVACLLVNLRLINLFARVRKYRLLSLRFALPDFLIRIEQFRLALPMLLVRAKAAASASL